MFTLKLSADTDLSESSQDFLYVLDKKESSDLYVWFVSLIMQSAFFSKANIFTRKELLPLVSLKYGWNRMNESEKYILVIEIQKD